MKRLFSLLALMVAFCSFSFATVRTVSNMMPSPGQYSNFVDAMFASSDGDTIYVHGSTIGYGTVFIDRALVVIGTGHNPNKQNPVVSSFLDIIITSNNVTLIGLRMRHLGTNGQANCVVKKCRITGDGNNFPMSLIAAANWLIEGNIIESPNTYQCIHFWSFPSANTIIQNNVLITPTVAITGIVNGSSDRTYILNNVFLGGAGFRYAFSSVEYCNIDNNIFYQVAPDGGGVPNSTMNNNISFASSVDNNFYQPGANNLANIDPLFVSYTGPATLYDYSWDLNLQATSPGHNTGTDGTDRGVFGGPGFKFTVTGEPSIAEITAFTITSPTVIAPGGSLTISVTSKRVH